MANTEYTPSKILKKFWEVENNPEQHLSLIITPILVILHKISMHSISQCLGGLLWSYWRGLGVVKLVGAVRVKNGSPTGGRKGEMAVRPTCAICIYCFICSAFHMHSNAFHMQWISCDLLSIYPTGVSKWNIPPVIGQLYLRDGSSPGKYMRLMASNWRPRRSSWCPQKSPSIPPTPKNTSKKCLWVVH